MSTADICILTASANLSRDIFQRYLHPDVEQRQLFRLSMLASIVIGVLATLLAWRMRDIIDILLVGFTINSAALFVPSVAMIYLAKTNADAAFWSMFLSLMTVVIVYFFGVEITSALAGLFGNFAPPTWYFANPIWPGLTVSVVAFWAWQRGGKKSA